ncbi:MAG TPA: hypothetical protein PKL85_03115 [Bacteroidia bacterium]|nr:hypothetical protein [Bacteroidia bacterium]
MNQKHRILLLFLGVLFLTANLYSKPKLKVPAMQQNILKVDSPIRVVLQSTNDSLYIGGTPMLYLKEREKSRFEKVQPYLGFIGVFVGFLLGWWLTSRTRRTDRDNQIADRARDRELVLLDRRIDKHENLIDSLRTTRENQISIFFKMRRMLNESMHHNFNWRLMELQIRQYPEGKKSYQPLIENQIAEYNSKKGTYQDLVGEAASLFSRFTPFLSKEDQEKYKTLIIDIHEVNTDVFQYVQMNKEGKDYTIYLKEGNNIDAIYVKDFFDKVVNPLQDLQRKVIAELEKKVIT